METIPAVPSPPSSGEKTRACPILDTGVRGQKGYSYTIQLPFDMASALEGICREVPLKAIIKSDEFFPYATHFDLTDLDGSVFFSFDGIAARLNTAARHSVLATPQSPTVQEIAISMARVWGKIFTGHHLSPLSFGKQCIIKNPDGLALHYVRMVPIIEGAGHVSFNAWIYDNDGDLCEAILGIMLSPESSAAGDPIESMGDKNKVVVHQPPHPRIRFGAGTDPLTPGERELIKHGQYLLPPCGGGLRWRVELLQNKNKVSSGFFQGQCYALAIVELKTMANFAPKAFSELERTCFEKLGARRGQSFTAARLACKYLWRKLHKEGKDEPLVPANSINTIAPDLIHPDCPLNEGERPYRCSVSHDNRFAIAVLGKNRIGVDVEKVSEKVLKTSRLFINEKENLLVSQASFGAIQASLRIWSIKESVAKALDISLFEAWKVVQVAGIETNESLFKINDKSYKAFHDRVDDHLFTLVEMS